MGASAREGRPPSSSSLWRALAAAFLLAAGLGGPAEAQAPPANVAVTPEAPFAYVNTSLAADPRDPNRLALAYTVRPEQKVCGLALSGDGGRTWKAEALVGKGGDFGLPEGRFPLPEGFTGCNPAPRLDNYPSVAYGPEGTLYYVMNLDATRGTPDKVFITRSLDGGATFEALKSFDPNVPEGDDSPAIAVDGQNSRRVYVSWRRSGLENRDNRILVAASGDGGQNFLAPKLADSALQPTSTTSRAAVGPDGRLYVVFADVSAALASNGVLPVNAYVVSSRDQGQSFSSPAPAADIGSGCNNLSCDELHNTGPSDISSLAAGPSAGQLQLAFWDLVDGKYRLLLRSSGDGGRSWSQSRVFGIPPGRGGHEQHRPSVSIAPGGRIDIAYYDIAPADANGERAQDVYSIYSCDGGASFSVPRRLSAVASNTAIGPPKSGSRGTVLPFGLVGAASAETELFGSWTDSRRGRRNREDPDDPFNRKQDVFFASLGAPLCGGQSPGPGRPPVPVLSGPDSGQLPGQGAGGGPGGGAPGGGGPGGAVAGCARGKNVIAATDGDDRRGGTNAADEIFAGPGNDVIDGLAGDDCIDLGPGRDRGQGSRGNDLVVGGLGADVVGGSSGKDRLLGDSGNDRLAGGFGDDRVLGGTGRDRIDGGFGADRLHGLGRDDRLVGSRGRDRINGGRGNDRLAGGSSADEVNGDPGNDRITGDSSGDILRGNSGNDRISGGSGRDRVSGGSGRDRVFGGSGNDRIRAHDGQRDRITCGRGRDTVIADRSDRISKSCERVRRR